jgi:hypothetical protein
MGADGPTSAVSRLRDYLSRPSVCDEIRAAEGEATSSRPVQSASTARRSHPRSGGGAGQAHVFSPKIDFVDSSAPLSRWMPGTRPRWAAGAPWNESGQADAFDVPPRIFSTFA